MRAAHEPRAGIKVATFCYLLPAPIMGARAFDYKQPNGLQIHRSRSFTRNP
jgi:hypothetical protein